MSKLDVCLRHISEVYLYEYYCLGSDEYEISGNDALTPHKEKAKELSLRLITETLDGIIWRNIIRKYLQHVTSIANALKNPSRLMLSWNF